MSFFALYIWGGVRVTVLNTSFNNQFYHADQFYWQRRQKYSEITTDLLQISHWQTLSHNVVSCTSHHERDSNSQCKNCKSNYHMITMVTRGNNSTVIQNIEVSIWLIKNPQREITWKDTLVVYSSPKPSKFINSWLIPTKGSN